MFTYDENTFSDLHKEAFGFRPSSYAWAEWNEASPARKQEIWDDLCDAHSRAMDEERAREAAAVASFEERISALIEVGARDRETAGRWLVESLGMDDCDRMYGGSYVCYTLGLPYSMSPTFDPILKSAA